MDFHIAISQAITLYGVEGDQEDLEEIGLIAYKKIGNKNTTFHKIVLPIIKGVVTLPCDVTYVEAVTYCGEDYNYTSNITYDDSQGIEEYIESEKVNNDNLYISGRFVKYRQVGNLLYTQAQCGKVNILYHSNVDTDLPNITEAECDAIAAYIAYTQKYKEALKTHNQIIFAEAQSLEKEWKTQCNKARNPEYVSQNDIDQMLNATASWDRKTYNKSFKPVR